MKDTSLIRELDAYRTLAEAAWDTFDQLSDVHNIQLGNRNLKVSVFDELLHETEQMAIKYQRLYFNRYWRTHDCECRPDDSGPTCLVCQAIRKSRSNYREEM